MPRPIHFEIPADDPERAVKFYEQVFGWKFKKWDGPQEYWLVTTGESPHGINGGLMRRTPPFSGTINIVDVSSADEAIEKIEGHGGKTIVPKMSIPGVGIVAYFQDTEGTMFGIIQPEMPPQAQS
jgi:predicted enzyme related to lactoylglutathione lyase